MSVGEAVERWVYETLAGSSSLTSLLGDPEAIYSEMAPENAQLPMVVYSVIGSGDSVPQGSRQLVKYSLVVRATSRGGTAPHGLAELVDEALHGQVALILTDSATLQCARVADGPATTEVVDGVRFRSRGGTYEVLVSPPIS
jgi:hypothetical protein